MYMYTTPCIPFAVRRPDRRFGKFRRIIRTVGRGKLQGAKEPRGTGMWRHPSVALTLSLTAIPTTVRNQEAEPTSSPFQATQSHSANNHLRSSRSAQYCRYSSGCRKPPEPGIVGGGSSQRSHLSKFLRGSDVHLWLLCRKRRRRRRRQRRCPESPG